MSDQSKHLDDIYDNPTRIHAAIREGVRDALRRHKLLGESIVEWRDGKIVVVPADEIEIPDPIQVETNHASKSSDEQRTP